MSLKTINNTLPFDKKSQLSNSTLQNKFLRRTSRSKSFKIDRSHSQSSLQNQFPSQYIKKLPKFFSKNNQEEHQTSDVTPVKLFERKNQLTQKSDKKRTPTPSKSFRELTDSIRTVKKINNDGINLQKQMQIHELEKKLAGESKIRSIFQQKAKQFQNQVSVQAKKARQLQRILEEEKVKQSKYLMRIKQLQSMVQNRSTDLKNAKSNLQKLKENIKETRTNEYLQQIKKLNQQVQKYQNMQKSQNLLINSLKNQNIRLLNQIQKIKNQNQTLNHKNQQDIKYLSLKRQYQHLKQQISKSKSEKQAFLEQKVNQIQQEVIKLKQINKQKIIEIDFLNRKKHQEMQMLRKRKSEQIKAVRIKYSHLMDEYKLLKMRRQSPKTKDSKEKTKDKDKIQRLHSKKQRQKSLQKRQNRFLSPPRGHVDDQLITFDLSPDCK